MKPIFLAAGVALTLGSPAHAVNADFQDFFFQVCSNPGASLAARCAQTPGGAGDLSGDSESSLNPSQTLSQGDGALDIAQQRNQELRERLQRGAGGADAGVAIDNSGFTLTINGRRTDSEYDRTVDVDAERAYEAEQDTLELGLDYRVSDALVVGGWLHWTDNDLDFDGEANGVNFNPVAGSAGHVASDGIGGTVYLSAQLGERSYLDASLGFSRLDYDMSRNAVFQETTRTIAQTNVFTRADTDGDIFSASLNWGYLAQAGEWQITPSLGLSYVSAETDAYSETDLTDSGLALRVDAEDAQALTGSVGVAFSRAVSMQGWVMLPQLRLDYVHELSSDRSEAQVQFLQDQNATVFDLKGDENEDDRLDVSLGVVAVLKNGWMPYVEYQYSTAGGDLDRYRIALGLRVEL